MKGVRQAGLDLGIGRVEFHHPARMSGYTTSYDFDSFKTLFDQSVGNGADGLAIAVTSPDVADYMESVCTNSKPCVSINSGMFDGLSKGAFTHFGMEEFTAGAAAADKFVQDGLTELFCFVFDDTNQGIVDRCQGAVKMFTCADDSGLAYDEYDADRPISCPEDRSGNTATVVNIYESNRACNDTP